MNLPVFFEKSIYSVSQYVLRKRQELFFNATIKKNPDVILMVVPDEVLRSGGILSIFSFYYETKKLLNKSVFICTYANGVALSKYDWFSNDVKLISLDTVLNSEKYIRSLLIHIPEYYVDVFSWNLTNRQVSKIKSVKNVHINVMNQNNELMLKPAAFNRIRELSDKLTITTAHSSYTTPKLRHDYNSPVHLLSAWFEQTPIIPKTYKDKKDIIIISPDEHPMKELILQKIKNELPSLKQVIIKNMNYDDFKKLESDAKWSISFGEGFDGYIIFPMLKGSIGFAVYNDVFFEKKYKPFENFYSSYSEMLDKIVYDIMRLDNEKDYDLYNEVVRKALAEEYNHDLYVSRVKNFYDNNYTFA